MFINMNVAATLITPTTAMIKLSKETPFAIILMSDSSATYPIPYKIQKFIPRPGTNKGIEEAYPLFSG